MPEMYEPYYNYITDGYDIGYEFDLINDKNQLVIMYGTSIIILDIDTFEVLNYGSFDGIKNYGINIFHENNIYIVEDILHNFSYFDENLNVLSEDNGIVKTFKDKADK